jgi:hypothetical protein
MDQRMIDMTLKLLQRGRVCCKVVFGVYLPAHLDVWPIIHSPYTSEKPLCIV